MKKARQILAIIGIILLVAMYAFTLFAALTDNPKTMHILGASIALTILVPVIIWVFGIFLRISQDDRKKNQNASSASSSSANRPDHNSHNNQNNRKH